MIKYQTCRHAPSHNIALAVVSYVAPGWPPAMTVFSPVMSHCLWELD